MDSVSGQCIVDSIGGQCLVDNVRRQCLVDVSGQCWWTMLMDSVG